MTIEQAKKLDHFMCSDCAEENDEKKPSNGYEPNELKVSSYFIHYKKVIIFHS
jgi:hypothetical protein